MFIAVGTPQGHDGSADLSGVWAVADAIATHLNGPKIVVIKSTVPVGTNRAVAERMAKLAKHSFDVASNPEFLKEGAAIDDCTKPDRVVVGVRRPEVGEVLQELYAPFLRTERPFLVMSPESAEMTKYVANAMLATKISFINEMANLCERMDADINDVRRGIGHDARIGFQFLFPGSGYGGSCFPKDIRAIIGMSRQLDGSTRIMQAVDEVNEAQKQVLVTQNQEALRRQIEGQDAGHLGPGVQAAHRRHPRGAGAGADRRHARRRRQAARSRPGGDAERQGDLRRQAGVLRPAVRRLEDADGLAIVTEWKEFRNPDFEVMRRLLREKVIFDGRNLYEPKIPASFGFTYYSIGRTPIIAAK